MRTARFLFGIIAASTLIHTASSQMVTIPFPNAQFKASVEATGVLAGGKGCVALYTVPTDAKFRFTTLILDSYNSQVPLGGYVLCTGKSVCETTRSAYLTAPAGVSLVINFTSGSLVASGDTLFACGEAVPESFWSVYGFLYTS